MRYCAMDDFTPTVRADGGDWAETEVLGGVAVVKVRASDATLTAINAEPGFLRVPKSRLDDSLADLSPAVKSAIVSKLRDMGYPLAELQAAFPNDLGTYTLGDVLRFAARRRLLHRWDGTNETWGSEQPVTSLDAVDQMVST